MREWSLCCAPIENAGAYIDSSSFPTDCRRTPGPGSPQLKKLCYYLPDKRPSSTLRAPLISRHVAIPPRFISILSPILRRSQFHCIVSLYATITLMYIVGSKILSQEIFISLEIFHLYKYLTYVLFANKKKLSKLNIYYIHGISIFLWSFHVFTHSIIGTYWNFMFLTYLYKRMT